MSSEMMALVGKNCLLKGATGLNIVFNHQIMTLIGSFEAMNVKSTCPQPQLYSAFRAKAVSNLKPRQLDFCSRFPLLRLAEILFEGAEDECKQ